MVEVIRASEVLLPPMERFGFCEGVEAAHRLLTRVVDVAEVYDVPVFGYHGIVHNESVIKYHEERGVTFVDDIEEMPEGKFVAVGSAHGSSPAIPYGVRKKGGLFVDGVCSLVTHTHRAVSTARRNDEKLLYIRGGNAHHDEVVGTRGHMNFYLDELGELRDDEPVRRVELVLPSDDFEAEAGHAMEAVLDEGGLYRVVGQTTLIASDIGRYINELGKAIMQHQPGAEIGRLDARRQVCFAVEDRQLGVVDGVEAQPLPDVALVVTDPNSKNGMSYATLAGQVGDPDLKVITVANAGDLTQHSEKIGGRRVFVTASASTADDTTREVVVSIGGDGSRVPVERPAFRIPDTTEQDLHRRINEWLDAA